MKFLISGSLIPYTCTLYCVWKRQMEFLGHVCRRRGLELLSLTGKVEGKRDRGKQRITFLDSLCNSATGGQSKGLNFLKLSDDRDVLERHGRQCLFQIWHLMMMMMILCLGLHVFKFLIDVLSIMENEIKQQGICK